ncbi:MAG TPA: carbamate kinase [Lactobacillus sp.]|nr:carbamate kinase [Lactobacillus sp.]
MAKIVVALGGNAILSADASAQAQMTAVKATAKSLVNFVKNGDQLIITHGNGPQVGNLLLQQAAADSTDNPALPLDTCGAMTQGSIGYWLQNAMREELLSVGIDKNVISIVTQTIVSESDPAFQNPSKPIGPFYTKAEASNIKTKHADWRFIEDAGRGYRRVVPSPKPIEVNESRAIKQIIDMGMIPIVSGGGGIPVIRSGNRLIGTEAVIDKDFSAAKIAQLVDADRLIILTSVDGVFFNYGRSDAIEIKKVGVAELQQHVENNEFAKGSMLPKVEAVIEFVREAGKPAVIGSLEDVKQIIDGLAGTTVVKAKIATITK